MNNFPRDASVSGSFLREPLFDPISSLFDKQYQTWTSFLVLTPAIVLMFWFFFMRSSLMTYLEASHLSLSHNNLGHKKVFFRNVKHHGQWFTNRNVRWFTLGKGSNFYLPVHTHFLALWADIHISLTPLLVISCWVELSMSGLMVMLTISDPKSLQASSALLHST